MNNTQAFIGLGLAFLGGAALGAGLGYRIAVGKLDMKYNEQMEEEIARTRAHYERTYKAGDFETPASAAEALGVVGEAADALLTYQGLDEENKKAFLDARNRFVPEDERIQDVEIVEEESVEEHNVFEKSSEDYGFSPRDPERPYMITMIEFGENEPDHDQVSITYYAGDKILADDKDKPLADADRCVGLDNLQKFGGMPDPTIILVRNERLRMDYEVNLREGKYAHEVAGFRHSDETFERRPRRRSADE